MIEHGFEIERDIATDPSRKRRRRRDVAPPPEFALDDEPGGALFDVLCGGRFFYALASALAAGALLIFFNPKFGTVGSAWPWAVFSNWEVADLPLPRWSASLALIVVLGATALGLALAALLPSRPWRGRLALFFVAMLAATFATEAATDVFLPVLLVGALTGGLIYAAREGRARVGLIGALVLVTAAYLFLPLPNGISGTSPRFVGDDGYDAVALSVVGGHLDAEAEADRDGTGRLDAHLAWLRAALADHVLLLVFALGLLALLGVRGASMGVLAGLLALALVGGLTWVGYKQGVDGTTTANAEWMAGAGGVAAIWTSHLVLAVLALAAGVGDLALRPR